jgi:hypothetical protein
VVLALRMVGVLLLLAVGTATGCTAKTGNQAGGPTPTAATGSSSPAPDPGGTPGGEEGAGTSSASPVLQDGRHPVFLTGLDASGRAVTFDLIQFLTGDEAKKAWLKLHPDQPDGPDNDYFIVNDNPRLRTLPIADPVQIMVLDLGSPSGVTSVSITLDALPAHLAKEKPAAGDKRLSYNPYWLTVAGGQVTRVEEQFVP